MTGLFCNLLWPMRGALDSFGGLLRPRRSLPRVRAAMRRQSRQSVPSAGALARRIRNLRDVLRSWPLTTQRMYWRPCITRRRGFLLAGPNVVRQRVGPLLWPGSLWAPQISSTAPVHLRIFVRDQWHVLSNMDMETLPPPPPPPPDSPKDLLPACLPSEILWGTSGNDRCGYAHNAQNVLGMSGGAQYFPSLDTSPSSGVN